MSGAQRRQDEEGRRALTVACLAIGGVEPSDQVVSLGAVVSSERACSHCDGPVRLRLWLCIEPCGCANINVGDRAVAGIE